MADPDRRFVQGQKVIALVGGMGRSINGSYAELVRVPSSNVIAVQSDLAWEELAAIPESYATAWTSVVSILQLARHQTVLIRGATSALGLAAVNIGVEIGARVMATTRQPSRAVLLKALGAHEVFLEAPELHEQVRDRYPHGIDAVLDIVGSSTVLGSLATLRRGGRVCVVGFLGRGGPLTLEPVFQIPSGTFLSAFASALVTGTPEFPLAEISLETIVERVAAGTYKATPAKVFPFERIQDAHRLLEANEVVGKVVVTL
jgi:NADPH:quinone reductase-like Zn-dependent oxidoreductase